MSMHHEIGLTCPQCGKAGIFTVWDSVNTKLDPDAAAAVKSQELFRYHCPHCGTAVTVNYGFLYHDMGRHFMIYYAPGDDDVANANKDMKDNEGKFQSMIESAAYVYRLVRTKEDLLEKITIFEAGLDDRLMELTKAAALAQVGEKEKDFTVTESHFVTADDGSLRLSLVDEKRGQQAYVDFTNGLAQLYGQFQQHFADDLPAEDAVLARIDADWTQRFLNKYLYN
ncbi:CpXC domain-containing protein [uncultured Megasphaera sp.]|uniref:CpXC domain-containing protein n=1 Tax=uncultured Megasphaera sp. TaxID=165188 RepID=UPI0025DC10A7|nr:CpXC domain-containing protein [uncultured Megasphaera sp.]